MPWQKGQSGNPGGRSKGARTKLTDAFIRTVARDWEAHGEEVIRRVREEHPAAYLKALVSLLPKDVTVEGHISETMTCGSLPATEALFERFASERNDRPKDGSESRH